MRFRCPITLPNRLAQLDVLLLCNHIVHYIRLSFRFQSTLPRGERHLRREIQRQFIHNFNPRSREGSDVIPFILIVFLGISIRAPARGATNVFVYQFCKRKFQSALPRGERRFSFCISLQISIISIRAPARGATQCDRGKGVSQRFQSALPRGERHT